MSLAMLFHFLCVQHVSDINISIIRSLWLFCWITSSAVLFLVRCVFRCGCVGVVPHTTPAQPHRNSNTHRTKNNTTNVLIQQNSRKLLMMDILMSETCSARKMWNKIASDMKLVFYFSTKVLSFIAVRPKQQTNVPAHSPCRCLGFSITAFLLFGLQVKSHLSFAGIIRSSPNFAL